MSARCVVVLRTSLGGEEAGHETRQEGEDGHEDGGQGQLLARVLGVLLILDGLAWKKNEK